MKKILLWLMLLFPLSVLAAPQMMTLTIQFDMNKSRPPFIKRTIHFTKTIQINLKRSRYTLVMDTTRIVNEFPETVALLVKPLKDTNGNELKFLLVEYGMNHRSEIISSPELVLHNNAAIFNIDDDNTLTIRVTRQ